MKTRDVIEKYGTQAKIAEVLGISAAAVAQWGEDVPLLRQYQLREIEAKAREARA